MRLEVRARGPFERWPFVWPQTPDPHAPDVHHDDTSDSPTPHRFGIAGGFDVPGTVVPGTAGVIGVAGGVVVEPGPVPGMHGGWMMPGAAPLAAIVGAGATGEDFGG
jgi:hypothetical protein